MQWHEVVGVVEDVRENGVQDKAPAMVYWPSMTYGIYGPHTFDAQRTVTFVLRSDRAGTERLLSEMRQAVWSVNASLPLASVRTMQEIYSQSLARTSFTLVMLGIAGTMAFVLGIIGIYGVISYSVLQRTREIGIRLALGEQTGTAKVDVHPVRIDTDGKRRSRRSGRGRGIDATDEVAAVWCQSTGPFYLRLGPDRFGSVRCARQLSARLAVPRR